MSLSAINSQYVGLNGLSGYGGFGTSFAGGGLFSNAWVDTAKTSIQNGYEINAMSNSYSNKAGVSSSSFGQQCQAVEYLLQQGRTDDAMQKYNQLYTDMASNPYYQGYGENEIKTLLQDKYVEATGTTIVNDIATNSHSSFTAGALSSIPVFGLMANTNSKDDFIAQATGTKKSKTSTVSNVAGLATTAAVSGGLAAGGVALAKVLGKGSGKGKILAAAIAAGASILTYIGGKAFKSNN